ncbi:MAG: hypothetical protein ABIZ64_16575 [Casimicrobium sp.]|jgi:ABC-type amino acid transport system permease subunit
MNPIDIKALPFSSKASICWSFFWRGIVITVASTLCAALIGGILGFLLGFGGFGKAVPIVGGVLGLMVGIYFLYLFLRWLLSSRLGSFHLVLVQADE